MSRHTKQAWPKNSLTAVALIGLCIMAAGQEIQTADLDATEILSRCDAAEGYESSFGEMIQTITTSGGQKRTLTIRAWGVNDGEKQLMEYLDPADVRGQKILMTHFGNDIWMFNPETRRTRKLGSHMKRRKVMGSDFTYEDQAGGRLVKKYTGSFIRQEREGGTDCYVLQLEPTPEGPSYAKVVTWIGKEDYITRRADFYREGDSEPFKRLICADIRRAGKKLFPHTMTMTNLEDRTDTVNVIDRIRFGVEIPDSIFESRNLSR